MGAGASSMATFEPRLRQKDDGERTTEVHRFLAHGDTWIQAVYTNEGSTVERILSMYLEWLKEEKYRFVGLDLEYNFEQNKIEVMQIAMKEHVLVFHRIRYVLFRFHLFWSSIYADLVLLLLLLPSML